MLLLSWVDAISGNYNTFDPNVTGWIKNLDYSVSRTYTAVFEKRHKIITVFENDSKILIFGERSELR